MRLPRGVSLSRKSKSARIAAFPCSSAPWTFAWMYARGRGLRPWHQKTGAVIGCPVAFVRMTSSLRSQRDMCTCQFTGGRATPCRGRSRGRGGRDDVSGLFRPAWRRRRRGRDIAPTAAERAVERDERRQSIAARLDEGGLGGEELLQGVEDLEIGRQPGLVTPGREAHRLACRVDG